VVGADADGKPTSIAGRCRRRERTLGARYQKYRIAPRVGQIEETVTGTEKRYLEPVVMLFCGSLHFT